MRILVIDETEYVRCGLEIFLQGADAELLSDPQLLPNVLDGSLCVDVVVLEIWEALEENLKLKLIADLVAMQVKVVVFSKYDNPTYIAQCVALGASDYVLQSSSRDDVVKAIVNAQAGCPPGQLFQNMKRTLSDNSKAPDTALTARESQALRHISLGLSNQEIALSLGINVETAKDHVQNIFKKTGKRGRTIVAVWAIQNGVI